MSVVLFICTGNTCRSPMAEAFAKRKYAGDAPDVAFISRGISAASGSTANITAARVMWETYGVDISEHTAYSVTAEDIERADVIVAMSETQLWYLYAQFPAQCAAARQKAHVLTVMAGRGGDGVADPFGSDETVYARCAGEIKACVDSIDFARYLGKK